MEITIRKVKPGDESTLVYIQTESWKAAFAHILEPDVLAKNTDIHKSAAMYQRLLEGNIGNGYILSVNGKPHCLAFWNAARDADYEGKAELIAIHSLPDNWRKGYGSRMMDHILEEIRQSGFSEVVLWVFRDNLNARAFYEAKGFKLTGISKPALGTEEVLYARTLGQP